MNTYTQTSLSARNDVKGEQKDNKDLIHFSESEGDDNPDKFTVNQKTKKSNILFKAETRF